MGSHGWQAPALSAASHPGEPPSMPCLSPFCKESNQPYRV